MQTGNRSSGRRRDKRRLFLSLMACLFEANRVVYLVLRLICSAKSKKTLLKNAVSSIRYLIKLLKAKHLKESRLLLFSGCHFANVLQRSVFCRAYRICCFDNRNGNLGAFSSLTSLLIEYLHCSRLLHFLLQCNYTLP